MRDRVTRSKRLVTWLASFRPASALFWPRPAPLAPAVAPRFTVINTADIAAPGSLRQAILDSNASDGVLDTIAFDIPGSGVHTITVATQLPFITDPVVLDGTTQPGYAGQPLIELNPSLPIGIGLRISLGREHRARPRDQRLQSA